MRLMVNEQGAASSAIPMGISRCYSAMAFSRSEPSDPNLTAQIDHYSGATVLMNSVDSTVFCYSDAIVLCCICSSHPSFSEPTTHTQCHGIIAPCNVRGFVSNEQRAAEDMCNLTTSICRLEERLLLPPPAAATHDWAMC